MKGYLTTRPAPSDLPSSRSGSLHDATGRRSNLGNRGKLPDDAGWILTDPDGLVVDKAMGRYRQIVGCRHAAEDAARQVVFGAMAGTEVTPGPVRGGQAVAGGRIEHRNTSEMGADTHQQAVFGLCRAMPVVGIRRLLRRAGICVGQPRQQFRVLQRLECSRWTIDNEDRSRAPAHHHLLARLNLAKVEID